MQLDQSFEVACPIDVVWRNFGDLPATASCIPGAEITNVEGNDKASGVFKVQLGPIKAAFAGDAEVMRDDATHSGTITGAGKDGKNATRVKAAVNYRLEAIGDATTRVVLSVEYNISGPLAQFSRAGIMKEIAGSITRMFAANLETMLAASVQSISPAATPQSPASFAGGPAAASIAPASISEIENSTVASKVASPQSLNLGSLVWSAIWHKIRSLFLLRAP